MGVIENLHFLTLIYEDIDVREAEMNYVFC